MVLRVLSRPYYRLRKLYFNVAETISYEYIGSFKVPTTGHQSRKDLVMVGDPIISQLLFHVSLYYISIDVKLGLGRLVLRIKRNKLVRVRLVPHRLVGCSKRPLKSSRRWVRTAATNYTPNSGNLTTSMTPTNRIEMRNNSN